MANLTLYQTDAPIRQADNDAHLVEMWLVGKSPKTVTAYRRAVNALRQFTGNTPLAQIRLGDLQEFQIVAVSIGVRTAIQYVRALKSLWTFAVKLGYLPLNIAAPLVTPKIKDTLAERIFTEADALKMIALTDDDRNRAILTILYYGGLRNAELIALAWRDVTFDSDGKATLNVFGKGGKTRPVLLPKTAADALRAVMPEKPAPDTPIFASRTRRSKKHAGMDQSRINQIIRAAAARADIRHPITKETLKVSPHWWRHAHASHALQRGADIALVQTNLGHASPVTTGRYLHVRPKTGSSLFLPQ